MGTTVTTPGAACGHWGPDTATTNTLKRAPSSSVKCDLCLEEEIRSEANFEGIVGQSAALRQVLQQVETAATTDSTVLLLGETGTGKELIARAIHARSHRRERALVKLNCAAIPNGLLESELFGHERGAFTGAITQKMGRLELADQGTLFLDEVGDITLEHPNRRTTPLRAGVLEVADQFAFLAIDADDRETLLPEASPERRDVLELLVTTDDAQVDAHITTVSTRVPGYVEKLFVNDNVDVKAGDPLAEIDPRDYQAAVDQAETKYDAAIARARTAKLDIRLTRDTTTSTVEGALAAKAAAEASLLRTNKSFEQTATASWKASEANVQAKLAHNTRAQADLVRYRPLVKTGDVSELQFDEVDATARVAASELELANQQLAEARKAVDIAQAQTTAAAAELSRSEAQVRGSKAQTQQVPLREAQYQASLATVEQAKAQLEEARLQLGYTMIRAPISGQVTDKHVQLGDYVSPGQLLLTIVPLQDVFVTANFKETELARVRTGQRAVIRADMYGRQGFEGVVDSLAGSTGSQQALLPPQNATGNFVKVVQRIPVKTLVKRSPRSEET